MLVEKIGRRRMTLFGFSGACTGILVMGIAGMFDYTKPNLAAVLVSIAEYDSSGIARR